MRIAVNIVRVFLGLLFLASSVTYFLDLVPAPEMEGDLRTFNEGLMASRYLFPLVKTVELVVAIAFLSGPFRSAGSGAVVSRNGEHISRSSFSRSGRTAPRDRCADEPSLSRIRLLGSFPEASGSENRIFPSAAVF